MSKILLQYFKYIGINNKLEVKGERMKINLWKRRTSLKDLEKIAREAPKFEYEASRAEDHGGYPSRYFASGPVSREALTAEYGKNGINISWQWGGYYGEGKGFREDLLWTVDGYKKGKDGIEFFYRRNYCYQCNYPPEDRKRKKINDKLQKIALIAREKYLSQSIVHKGELEK